MALLARKPFRLVRGRHRSIAAVLGSPAVSSSRSFTVHHQVYHHPRDVPWFQVPTLGDGDFKGKDIDAEGFWDNPRSNYHNIREPEEHDVDYKFEGQDFPSWLWRQHPDLFLPEEQGFFEFYGTYPFVLFGGAAAVCYEFFPLWANAPNLPGVAWYFAFYLLYHDWLISHVSGAWVRRPILQQANHDRDWLGMKKLREGVQSLIGDFENDLKAKERADTFDAYTKALNNRKVAFFAHAREKAHSQNLLRRLTAIRAAETTYSERVKDEIITGGVKYVSEQFAERPEVRTNWNDQVFSVVKQHVETGDVSGYIEDPCQDLFNEYLEKTGAEIEASAEVEKSADSGSQIDAAGLTLQETVLKSISDLKVYEGPTEASKTYIPRTTGMFGDVPDALLQKQRDLKKIAERQLAIVEEQLARFKPDRQPESLVKRRELAQQRLAQAA